MQQTALSVSESSWLLSVGFLVVIGAAAGIAKEMKSLEKHSSFFNTMRLLVTFLAAVSGYVFLLKSFVLGRGVDGLVFWAHAVLVPLAVLLVSLGAWFTERKKRRELAKVGASENVDSAK